MDKFKIEYLNQSLIDEGLVKKTDLIKTDKYTMGAITTRGVNPKRQFNQDSSAIMVYPSNDDFAMFVMADGKDDSINGKGAAKEIVHALSEWFLSKSMSESYINIPVLLEGRLYGELRKLNRKLYDDALIGDASFAMAVVGKESTFIANVGNVRCYSVDKNDITLRTVDNLAWYLYNNPELITADEVKYLTGKDYVFRTIGKDDNSKRYFEPFVSIIENKDYDSLLMTTHGVNDVLDSYELFDIVKENDVSEALTSIIYNCLSSESKQYSEDLLLRFKGKENMLIEKTIPGDSNASAIVYKKSLK